MTTARCPLACPHCLAAEEEGTSGPELTVEEAARLIDGAAATGAAELLLTGGEPFAREDLPDVIERTAALGLPYAINTAVFPGPEVQRAVERHPPVFAAVSLDGPRDVHDAFRGKAGAFDAAVAAIGWFAKLGVRTAAGTTVTRFNLGALDRTFRLATRSGAASWGLHLLVPEGRARRRPDLFLRRHELRGLLRFAAARRSLFPVQVADEIGYCGDAEPLWRDLPMRCGAGTLQCVVLPDGEVVPCTTTDRTVSAGNVRERPLASIWAEGFAELRHPIPEPGCRKCTYLAACGGGCWLQRRAGAACARDLWERKPATRTAASLAVALGLSLACGPATAPVAPANGTVAEEAGTTPDVAAAEPADASPANRDDAAFASPADESRDETPGGDVDPGDAADGAAEGAAPTSAAGEIDAGPRSAFGGELEGIERDTGPGIEAHVLYWYGEQLPARERIGRFDSDLGGPPEPGDAADDPAFAFFERYRSGRLPRGLRQRCEAAREALGTSQRSLAFASLLWRSLVEAVLDGPDPASRSASDRRALAETLDVLRGKVAAWRSEIFRDRLEPYLARNRVHSHYRFEMVKAYVPPPNWLVLARDAAEERWGDSDEALEGWLERNAWGEALALEITTSDPEIRRRGSGEPLADGSVVGILDAIVVPAGAGRRIEVRGAAYGGDPWPVSLPGGTEATWADLVRLVDAASRADLTDRADRVRDEWVSDEPLDPLLLPRMRARGENARYWLADFWLF
jgi:radical SAM protein with 4Fe4S-binding SPASM domain